MAENTRYKKKKSIIWAVPAGVFAVALVLLYLLPTLVSTQWGGNKMKQVINDRLPGVIDFESISLGWFSGIKGRAISYDNSQQGIVVKVAELSTAKGLLALAVDRKELGRIDIKTPVAYMYLQEKAETAGARSQESSAQASEIPGETTRDTAGTQPDKGSEHGGQLILPPLNGDIAVSDGALHVFYPDSREAVLLKDFTLQTHFDGYDKRLEYQLAFQSGDSAGRVKGSGTITLPAGGNSTPEEVVAQAELDINTWEIADLLQLLNHTADAPTGSGQLNGRLSLSGSEATNRRLKGMISTRQLKLQGGPLTPDTPSFDSIALEIDAEQMGRTMNLNRLTLTSSLATAALTGTLESQGEKDISGTAEIDLKQLFGQFPGSLNLKEGTSISNGRVDLSMKMSAAGNDTHFEGSALLDQLQGAAGGKKLVWDTPVRLEARGMQRPEGLQLDDFTVQSAFLNGTGQGDINQMKVQLSADIGGAMTEIEKFIQLDGWKSNGKMDVNLQVETKSAELRSAAAIVNISDFTLQQHDTTIVPRHTFTAELASDLRLDQEMQPQEVLNTSVDFSSVVGDGSIKLATFLPASGQTSLQLEGLDAAVNLNLKNLTSLLQAVGVLPEDSRLAGNADIDAQLSFEAGRLALKQATVNATDLLFQKGGQTLSEKKMQLTTSGSVDLEKKSAALKPFELQTTTGTIALQELELNDWSTIQDGIKTRGRIDLELGRLAVFLADILELPDETSIAGQTTLTIDADLSDAGQQFVRIGGLIEPFELSLPDNKTLAEKKIELMIDLNGDAGEQTVVINRVEIASSPVSLEANGTINQENKERVLVAHGAMKLDLEALSGYIRSLSESKLEMTGISDIPFSVKATSLDGTWVEIPKRSEIVTTLHADKIRGSGMLVESLEVPIKVADGRAEIGIEGTVNNGKMSLQPAIDFSADSPLISISENNLVLAGVGLSEDMSRDLLAQVHPIFIGAAVSQGTLDLGLGYFNWPIRAAERRKAAFSSTITFNEVKLQAGGLLTLLLEVMKEDTREITIGDQPMECIGENDRIRCSPLEILVNEHALLFSGSIGFDASLDYVAQIPVTQRMVGADAYRYLEGTSISVPIGGTVSKPSIRKDVVQAALKDLVIQAGKKQITDQAGKLLQNLFKK